MEKKSLQLSKADEKKAYDLARKLYTVRSEKSELTRLEKKLTAELKPLTEKYDKRIEVKNYIVELIVKEIKVVSLKKALEYATIESLINEGLVNIDKKGFEEYLKRHEIPASPQDYLEKVKEETALYVKKKPRTYVKKK